ncbi:MAG: DegV family protein, partial [Clostridia bacterium]|nr:DegV family protein [Clostridia bacterium]
MKSFVLSCCSMLDLSPAHVADRDISYICFHYYMDDVAYADDLGQSMPFETFYQKMVEGADTRTSQINMEEYIDYFTPFLEEGRDILHVSLSSGISGTYNSARLAVEELTEKYPDRKIYVVDSLAAASGYGLLM